MRTIDSLVEKLRDFIDGERYPDILRKRAPCQTIANMKI